MNRLEQIVDYDRIISLYKVVIIEKYLLLICNVLLGKIYIEKIGLLK